MSSKNVMFKIVCQFISIILPDKMCEQVKLNNVEKVFFITLDYKLGESADLACDYEEWFDQTKDEFGRMIKRITHAGEIRTFGLDYILNELLTKLFNDFERLQLHTYKYLLITFGHTKIKIENTNANLSPDAILMVDEQMVDEQMVDEQMVDEQMVDEQMVDEQMVDEQMVDVPFCVAKTLLSFVGIIGGTICTVHAWRKRRQIYKYVRNLSKLIFKPTGG